jgi:hypothetical protein
MKKTIFLLSLLTTIASSNLAFANQKFTNCSKSNSAKFNLTIGEELLKDSHYYHASLSGSAFKAGTFFGGHDYNPETLKSIQMYELDGATKISFILTKQQHAPDTFAYLEQESDDTFTFYVLEENQPKALASNIICK